MEIKANFLLIGLFTLAGLGAILAAFLWLGALRIDRDMTRYGILFRDVSGLSEAGQVVFNGLPVGRVTALRLHDPDPSLIYVEVEVDTDTPVRADTVAQLTTQGVTGLSYIALLGGTTDAPFLPVDGTDPPLIPSRPAMLQTLIADVPGLVEEASALISDLRTMTGPETRDGIVGIVANLNAASGKLDATLDGMAGLTEGLSAAAIQIGGLGDTIAALDGDVRDTLAQADTALAAATEGFDAIAPAVADAREVMDLTRALLAGDAPDMLAAWRAAGGRLDGALVRSEDAMASIQDASDAVATLATGDGAALLASARAALDGATPALRDDLPAAMADLRAAAAETRGALDRIAGDVGGSTGQLDLLTTEARAALARATDLLDRAEPSLDTLDATLRSADDAFAAAAGVIDADLGPAMADLRAAATAIARDLPGLAARADAVLGDVAGAVQAVIPGLRAFGQTTLPEYGRVATEARTLIRTIADAVRRLEREPGQLLQRSRVPEYRRAP
ncbi:MAG: MlaD family protein [Pseudomonadota bacterium]